MKSRGKQLVQITVNVTDKVEKMNYPLIKLDLNVRRRINHG